MLFIGTEDAKFFVERGLDLDRLFNLADSHGPNSTALVGLVLVLKEAEIEGENALSFLESLYSKGWANVPTELEHAIKRFSWAGIKGEALKEFLLDLRDNYTESEIAALGRSAQVKAVELSTLPAEQRVAKLTRDNSWRELATKSKAARHR